VLSFALLRILWTPIGAAIDGGRLATPDTLLLLLGFVAIWLALLLAAGAVHVAMSAWWAMELARGGRRWMGDVEVGGQASRVAGDTGGAD
jgi:membrane protein implicated in regulation of membrane protease activity